MERDSEECDYCWGVEDNSDRFSDRTFKSGEILVLIYVEEIMIDRLET